MLKAVAVAASSAASGITAGTSVITGGTNTRVLFDDSGVIGESAGLTYTKASSLLTAGNVTVAAAGVLKLGNSATTGLTAGVLAALTNATIVITDASGQAYRIPCII